MALTYCVLASGSSGNCLWVRGGGMQILVDCGLSARMATRRLEAVGGRMEEIAAVVCTHGHSDHVGGVRVLGRKHGDLKVVATAGTQGCLPGGLEPGRMVDLPCAGQVTLGGLTITSVPTSHDSPGSVALRLSDGETSLGVVTDLGIASEAIVETFRGIDGLLLEMNHDVEMLANGPYPAYLKKRIRGNWGHLSNAQGAELLGKLLHDGLQHVTLGHISEHNNTVAHVREAAEGIVGARAASNLKLAVAEQRQTGEPVTLCSKKSPTQGWLFR